MVFSTYQSLPAVAEAQRAGLPEFDLIVCDEAHRTTGLTLAGEDESNFVRVHDQGFIRGAKRLYMTATPRIYDDGSKSKADQGSAVLTSMDDEKVYGPEFYRLGFGEAVEQGAAHRLQGAGARGGRERGQRHASRSSSRRNSELKLDDAAKIVGCWNGLAKRGDAESGFGTDAQPMKRAVAFARSIKDSKAFAALFTRIVNQQVRAATERANESSDESDANDEPRNSRCSVARRTTLTAPSTCSDATSGWIG